MEFIKNLLIGIGAFTVIGVVMFGLQYLLSDVAGLNKEQIGAVIMAMALLFIAPMFGELTRSVFKLDKSKS